MHSLGAKDARQGFAELLDTAQREPVMINKKGRPVAVIMSYVEYQRLEALEDEIWTMRAQEAEKEGFIGPKKGEKLLQDLLNAKD